MTSETKSEADPSRGLRPGLVADFGTQALGETDLDSLLQTASAAAAEGMGILRAKVLQYRPEQDDLLIRAGVNWKPGVVGSASLSAGMRSPPGRAFRTDQGVAIANLNEQTEFEHSRLLQEHNVVSVLNVPVHTRDEVWGVLEVDSEEAGRFTMEHSHFLQGLANVLGAAIDRLRTEQALAGANQALERRVAERTRQLVESNRHLRQQITERERAEAELRRREAEYRLIYNKAPAPQHSLDAEGRIVGVSDYWLELLGYRREDVLGRPLESFMTEPSAREFRERWAEFLENGEERGLELQFCKSSGEVVDALLSRRAEWDEAGRVRRTLGVLTDITAWRKAERERDRLFEISQDLIAILGFDGTFHDINPALEQALGYRLHEIHHRPYIDFVHPEDRTKLGEAIGRLRAGDTLARVELRYRRSDGEWRWTSWRATSVPQDGLIYALGRDVTERRQTEEALRQAQKMEAVGHLTGGVAHDFNNLLTVLMGNLELLRPRLAEHPRQLRMVDAMQHAVERGERLTGQLLAFSRRQKLQPEVLDVNRLIRDFAPLIRRAVGETVPLDLQLSEPLWPSNIDPAQLEAALLNLAVNARDAMPEGGRLVIATRTVEQETQLTERIIGASAGPYVVIAVSDSGEGMPPDVIARAFEPFFTTKEVGKGTGLGLSQVYGFVEQSGGHVTLDSTPGQGTTIQLYLPAASREPANATRTVGEADRQSRGGSERILLVEDNPYVLETASAMMAELGYQVQTASTPEEALELLRTSGDAFDLLFTDVVMPRMTGWQLVERARRIRPSLKVLLASGYSKETEARGGTGAVIAKPYRQADLAVRIRSTLDQRQP